MTESGFQFSLKELVTQQRHFVENRFLQNLTLTQVEILAPMLSSNEFKLFELSVLQQHTDALQLLLKSLWTNTTVRSLTMEGSFEIHLLAELLDANNSIQKLYLPLLLQLPKQQSEQPQQQLQIFDSMARNLRSLHVKLDFAGTISLLKSASQSATLHSIHIDIVDTTSSTNDDSIATAFGELLKSNKTMKILQIGGLLV